MEQKKITRAPHASNRKTIFRLRPSNNSSTRLAPTQLSNSLAGFRNS